MKTLKRLFCAVLTLCLCSSLFLIPSDSVSAATTAPSAPKTVTLSYYKDYPQVYDSAISIDLGKNGKAVKNIKSGSSNLKAKLTYLNTSNTNGSAEIGVYAKTTGTYKVTFDICGANGKKIKNLSVTVKVVTPTASTNNYPFKSLKFNGKNYNYNTVYTKNSVKINVKMNTGFKLKKIAYSTYTKPVVTDSSDYSTTLENSQVSSSVKNGGTIKLGQYSYYHSYDSVYTSLYSDSTSESHSKSESILAPTTVTITYTDKNKETNSYSYTLYRFAKNVQ